MKSKWEPGDVQPGQCTIRNGDQYVIGYMVDSALRESSEHYCLIRLTDGAVMKQYTRAELAERLTEWGHTPVRVGRYAGEAAGR
jgi:hypothetical protein